MGTVTPWTTETYAAHNDALRAADDRFQMERDRRYTEVNIEKEKALKIKETADLAALSLAREIQTYKDEKANLLREQINAERGLYASKSDLTAAVEKMEATLKPIVAYVAAQQGQGRGISLSANTIAWVLAAAVAVATLYVTLKPVSTSNLPPIVVNVPPLVTPPTTTTITKP